MKKLSAVPTSNIHYASMAVMYCNLLVCFSLYIMYLGEELNVCMCFGVSKSRYYGNLVTIFLQN